MLGTFTLEMYISWLARLTEVLEADEIRNESTNELLVSTGDMYISEWLSYQEKSARKHEYIYGKLCESHPNFFSTDEIQWLFHNSALCDYKIQWYLFNGENT